MRKFSIAGPDHNLNYRTNSKLRTKYEGQRTEQLI